MDLTPLWISLKTSITATFATFLLGIGAAWAMSRYRGRGRGFLDGILVLPLVLPPTVVGFFLLLLFGRGSLIGRILPIVFSWPATVVAATVVAFPLLYRTALGAFEQVNPNLLGAARTLGAGEWRVFRLVLLPLAWPGVKAGTVLAFARALGEFGATLMVAGNIPGRTQTMPVAIFFAAEGGDMRRALAWVGWIAVLSLGSIAALNRWAQPRRHTSPAIDDTAVLPWLGAEPVSRSTLAVEIHKRYPGFDLGISFASRGGTMGVLGASGSGKSLTLLSIAGLETPDEGRIEINGRVLFDSRAAVSVPAAQRRIGMVFQDYALFPHLTVRQNIAFGLDQRLPADRAKIVSHWARAVQLEPLLDRYPGALSGGQKQRTALARALAVNPEALLLDEPFSALDPHLRRQLEEELREILKQYGGVTLFVTHDRSEAYRFCRDLVVLDHGRVAAAGPKQEVFRRPKSLAVARITGCKNLAPVTALEDHLVRVDQWNCTLRVPEPGATHIGIRAHHIEFGDFAGQENAFPCWLIASTESPFETTLYLHLQSPPPAGARPHLEAELPNESWETLSRQPQPWHLKLPLSRLLILVG